MRTAATVVVAALALLAAASAGAYTEAPVPDGGTLTGRVGLVGEPVTGEAVEVRRNTDVCGTTKPFEALIVGPGNGIKDAVVYLEGIERGKRPPELELDNVDCVFVPHVSAATLGARARIRNGDPILHNTHGFLGRVTAFNIALPKRGQVVDITARLKKVGVIEVQCDAHTHMRAWIVVRDNPYYAVTDERGEFRIADIPPGRYRAVVWHQGWVATGSDKDGRPVYDEPRVVTREVTVPARGEARIEFELR